MVALLAGEALAPEAREDAPEARAVIADLRGELGRIMKRDQAPSDR